MDMRQLVAKNVKRCRTAAGLTQHELAARMGLDRAYVSGLEMGKRNPTVIMLWRIAEAIGVRPVDLLSEND
ncbi:MAG: helix-turn-helix transcriptional regulator [Mesorhizobium sp.]|uniref:helix-turn-helix domain-containing protein n=1 Tax=Mesorhizobium sp. TaxID=1871066 RepID=UPI001205E0BC|nr:helix-turn-helix transcriptional regulator [Mesorhizobium sp.]TIL63716.1 MAG: helix-turn-helix transcriptional regulator [Mesorhizobium sp.]TIL87496.1 MAG: helix-turn-helix transcriptional regulator [Mesorhizobium sp.]